MTGAYRGRSSRALFAGAAEAAAAHTPMLAVAVEDAADFFGEGGEREGFL